MGVNLLLAEDLERGVLLGAHGHLDHGGLEVGWEVGGQAVDGHLLDVLRVVPYSSVSSPGSYVLAFVCFTSTDTPFETFFMSNF